MSGEEDDALARCGRPLPGPAKHVMYARGPSSGSFISHKPVAAVDTSGQVWIDPNATPAQLREALDTSMTLLVSHADHTFAEKFARMSDGEALAFVARQFRLASSNLRAMRGEPGPGADDELMAARLESIAKKSSHAG